MVNILVAEDNIGDALLIQRALEEHGVAHEMHVVRDGGEALAFVARMGRPEEMIPCPDVFLLDLHLPKIDAPEILSAPRKHPACAQTPVIAVTSSIRRRIEHKWLSSAWRATSRNPRISKLFYNSEPSSVKSWRPTRSL